MLNRNTKYTAKEILTETGVEKLDGVFGKVRVRIAGIRGIVSPDHMIKLSADTASPVDIVVGVETYELELSEEKLENQVVTEEAKKATEAVGKELNKKAEEFKKLKESTEEESTE